VQRRRFVAGQHHVLDDDEFQLVVWVAQPLLERGVLRLLADVFLDESGVGGVTGVDDLDPPGGELVGMPPGAQRDDRRIQSRRSRGYRTRSVPYRALDERPHRRAAGLPVRHEILSEPGEALRVALDGDVVAEHLAGVALDVRVM
jgi:hypothetical protein